MPARYAADGPRVETDDEGVPWWIVEDKRMPILFANGAAGRVLEEWKGASRCSYEEFRPSVSEPIAAPRRHGRRGHLGIAVLRLHAVGLRR